MDIDNIKIRNGPDGFTGYHDVNVIIDVIRAFTVDYQAFCYGVSSIYLVKTVDEAFDLKKKNPNLLLAGEVNGYPIKGFDLDNSPVNPKLKQVKGKVLVQRSTNGVQATLNGLNAEKILVTGFSNAWATAKYIRQLLILNSSLSINLVISSENADEDMACADFIKELILNGKAKQEGYINRIIQSEAAKKFYDNEKHEFSIDELMACILISKSDFVMKVLIDECIPKIEKVMLL